MPNVSKDGVSVQPHDRERTHQLVVSDLNALIERIYASMDLIESAISCEKPFGNQEVAANVIVLDDISPVYMRANAALNVCSVDLSVALHFLMDIQVAGNGHEDVSFKEQVSPLSVRA